MNCFLKFIGLFLLCFSCLAQPSAKSYELNWKLEEGERLGYWTIMEETDSSAISTRQLFEEHSNGDDNFMEIFDKEYESIKKQMETKSMLSILEAQDDKVNVALVMGDFNQNSFEGEGFVKVRSGLHWRGSVNKNGGIESFYLRREQKNQLALFFELPDSPVKVGDTWEIELNLLTTVTSFRADSVYRNNQVKLLEVREENGDSIAKLQYQIEERLHGSWYLTKDDEIKVANSVTFDAICEFSITHGKWLKYEGRLSSVSAGTHKFVHENRFALIEAVEIPEQADQYLNPQ